MHIFNNSYHLERRKRCTIYRCPVVSVKTIFCRSCPHSLLTYNNVTNTEVNASQQLIREAFTSCIRNIVKMPANQHKVTAGKKKKKYACGFPWQLRTNAMHACVHGEESHVGDTCWRHAWKSSKVPCVLFAFSSFTSRRNRALLTSQTLANQAPLPSSPATAQQTTFSCLRSRFRSDFARAVWLRKRRGRKCVECVHVRTTCLRYTSLVLFFLLNLLFMSSALLQKSKQFPLGANALGGASLVFVYL